MVFFIFVVGTIVGSFVNVVIERTIRGEDWVRGRSRCDHCHKQIAWYDNIPLLSYILLGRKCRFCKKRISVQHPVVEFMTGCLFVWWYGVGSIFFQLTQKPLQVIQPAFWLIIGLLLLIILISDYVYMLIPTNALIGLLGLALAYRGYLTMVGAMQGVDLGLSLLSGLGAALFLWLLWFITRGKGMGMGDVWLALGMGWLLGWPRILVGLFVAFLSGAIVGIGLIMAKKKKMKQQLPFGPFLVLGTVVALMWGSSLAGWYVSLLR